MYQKIPYQDFIAVYKQTVDEHFPEGLTAEKILTLGDDTLEKIGKISLNKNICKIFGSITAFVELATPYAENVYRQVALQLGFPSYGRDQRYYWQVMNFFIDAINSDELSVKDTDIKSEHIRANIINDILSVNLDFKESCIQQRFG